MMDSMLAQTARLPSGDPPEYEVFRETMDRLLTQNAQLPSADPLPEQKVLCELTAMRQIVEPRLLRMESEIGSIVKASQSAGPLPEHKVLCELTAMRQIVEPRLLRMEWEIGSIVNASVSMKEALERIEQQQSVMSVRFEGKGVCDIDDHSRYLQAVERSISTHLQPTNLALEVVEQPLARPSEEIEDHSMHRGSSSMHTALVKGLDRPPMDIEDALRPDKMIVGHDEPNAVTPRINHEAIVNGLRAEHVQLQQIDLPNLQEPLRKVPREETQNHEVSMIQQVKAPQNYGKSVMNQSAEGQNQEESVMNRLLPIACMNHVSDKRSPDHDQQPKSASSPAGVQVIETARNPLASPISPIVKGQLPASSPMSAPPKTSEASPKKRTKWRRRLSNFDAWFELPKDGKISLQAENSFAGVFIHDRNLDQAPYRMEDFYKKTGWVQALVRSAWFQNFTVLVVVVNALWLGLAQDQNPSIKLYDSQLVFIIAETFFCSYFTIELALRFIAFTSAREAFRDGWFRFDLFLVATMILDTWVIMVIMQVMDRTTFRFPIAALRMLRLLKLTRMARLMVAFPELITMIRSLVRAVRAVASMCILVTLIIYMWGIIMNTLLKDEKRLNDRLLAQSKMDFSSLRNSMWILFINGALLLDNSAPLLTQLVFGETFTMQVAGIFMLVFVLLTAFLLLQMLTGIFCDVVIQVRQEHRNEADVRLIKQELAVMLKKIDDGDGKLTQKEVLEFINTGNAKAVLKHMGINLIFLYQLQEILFQRQPRIKIRDFLELMLLCRSSNQATVETLAGGFCFIGREIERIQMHLTLGSDATKTQDEMLNYAKKILVDD